VLLNNVCHVAVTISSAEGRTLDAVPLFEAAFRAKPGVLSVFPLAEHSASPAFLSERLHEGCFLWEVVVCGYGHAHTHTCREGCILLKKKKTCQQIISAYFGYHNPLQASTEHPYMFDQVTIKEKYCAILANWTTYTLVVL